MVSHPYASEYQPVAFQVFVGILFIGFECFGFYLNQDALADAYLPEPYTALHTCLTVTRGRTARDFIALIEG